MSIKTSVKSENLSPISKKDLKIAQTAQINQFFQLCTRGDVFYRLNLYANGQKINKSLVYSSEVSVS